MKGYIIGFFSNLIMGIINVIIIIVVGFSFLRNASFAFSSSSFYENIIGYIILGVFFSIVFVVNVMIVRKTTIPSIGTYSLISILTFALPYLLAVSL